MTTGNYPDLESRRRQRGVLREDAQGSMLLRFLLILARRRRFIVLMTLGFAIAGLVAALVIPAEYTATAVILPPRQSSSMGSSMAMQLAGLSSLAGLGDSLGMKNIDDLYIAMLKSRAVEDSVIRRFDLMTQYRKKYFYDARKKLEWHTTIDASKEDNLIHLSFEDHDPRRAVEIVNGYVDELRQMSSQIAVTEAGQRRIIFEQQLEKSKKSLADSEEALKQTEMKTGLVDLSSQSRALIETAARIRAEIVSREVQMQAMRSYAGEGNPALIEQQQALQSLRAQYGKLMGSNGEDNGDELFPTKKNVPQATLDYARKLRDVKYNESIFEVLARQLELAKLDEAKEGGLIQVVDPPTVPERRSFPKRAWFTLGFMAFGLSLAVALALLEVRLAQYRADPVKAEQLAALRDAVRTKPGDGATGAPEKPAQRTPETHVVNR